jgi:hypothetical protein
MSNPSRRSHQGPPCQNSDPSHHHKVDISRRNFVKGAAVVGVGLTTGIAPGEAVETSATEPISQPQMLGLTLEVNG